MENVLISHFPDTGKDGHDAQYCAVLEQCIKNQDFMSRLTGKAAFEPFAREIAYVRAMKMQELEGARKRIAN